MQNGLIDFKQKYLKLFTKYDIMISRKNVLLKFIKTSYIIFLKTRGQVFNRCLFYVTRKLMI